MNETIRLHLSMVLRKSTNANSTHDALITQQTFVLTVSHSRAIVSRQEVDKASIKLRSAMVALRMFDESSVSDVDVSSERIA